MRETEDAEKIRMLGSWLGPKEDLKNRKKKSRNPLGEMQATVNKEQTTKKEASPGARNVRGKWTTI